MKKATDYIPFEKDGSIASLINLQAEQFSNIDEIKLVEEYQQKKALYKQFEKAFKDFVKNKITPILAEQDTIEGDGASLESVFKEREVPAKDAFYSSWHQVELRKHK